MGVCEGRGCFARQDGNLDGLCGCLSEFGLVTVDSLGFFPDLYSLEIFICIIK
jgi:hypothetical protein